MRAYQIVNLLIKLSSTREIHFTMENDTTFVIKDGRLGSVTTVAVQGTKVTVTNKALQIGKITDTLPTLESTIINIVEQLETIAPIKYAAKVISTTSKRFNTVTYETDEIGEHIKLSDDKVLLTVRVTDVTLLVNTVNDNIPELTLTYENSDNTLLYDHLISAASIIDQL